MSCTTTSIFFFPKNWYAGVSYSRPVIICSYDCFILIFFQLDDSHIRFLEEIDDFLCLLRGSKREKLQFFIHSDVTDVTWSWCWRLIEIFLYNFSNSVRQIADNSAGIHSGSASDGSSASVGGMERSISSWGIMLFLNSWLRSIALGSNGWIPHLQKPLLKLLMDMLCSFAWSNIMAFVTSQMGILGMIEQPVWLWYGDWNEQINIIT